MSSIDSLIGPASRYARYGMATGEPHPSTVGSANDLAQLLQEQGQSDRADPLFREALAADEAVRGEAHHPSTMIMILSFSKIRREKRAQIFSTFS